MYTSHHQAATATCNSGVFGGGARCKPYPLADQPPRRPVLTYKRPHHHSRLLLRLKDLPPDILAQWKNLKPSRLIPFLKPSSPIPAGEKGSPADQSKYPSSSRPATARHHRRYTGEGLETRDPGGKLPPKDLLPSGRRPDSAKSKNVPGLWCSRAAAPGASRPSSPSTPVGAASPRLEHEGAGGCPPRVDRGRGARRRCWSAPAPRARSSAEFKRNSSL